VLNQNKVGSNCVKVIFYDQNNIFYEREEERIQRIPQSINYTNENQLVATKKENRCQYVRHAHHI
jgi:hypothetical protein